MCEVIEEIRKVCEDCGEILDRDADVEPLYECNNCGEKFTRENSATGGNHQCPGCMKFASRLGDGCPECGGGPVEDQTVYVCSECGEAYTDESDCIIHLDEHEDTGDEDFEGLEE